MFDDVCSTLYKKYCKSLKFCEFHVSCFCEIKYCRMLNVREHLSLRFGYVRRSRFLNLASVTSGVLFSYASCIFGESYFRKSKEPRETRVIKFSRKLSILQYHANILTVHCNNVTNEVCGIKFQ